MSLIYAMTRPDTGIITDLIKANIPSRAAFKVSTEDGSKYVLDQVSDFEIQKVVEY